MSAPALPPPLLRGETKRMSKLHTKQRTNRKVSKRASASNNVVRIASSNSIHGPEKRDGSNTKKSSPAKSTRKSKRKSAKKSRRANR